MPVIELPVVAFAEAHHFGHPGAVVDFDGFKAFEQAPLEPGDFSIEVFARAQEQRTIKDFLTNPDNFDLPSGTLLVQTGGTLLVTSDKILPIASDAAAMKYPSQAGKTHLQNIVVKKIATHTFLQSSALYLLTRKPSAQRTAPMKFP